MKSGKFNIHLPLQWDKVQSCSSRNPRKEVVLPPGDPLLSDETGSALSPRTYVFTFSRYFFLNLEHCF